MQLFNGLEDSKKFRQFVSLRGRLFDAFCPTIKIFFRQFLTIEFKEGSSTMWIVELSTSVIAFFL